MRQTTGKSAPSTGQTKVNTEDEIRRRAYEFYEARGREHGHDQEDWFRAEKEITGKKIQVVAA